MMQFSFDLISDLHTETWGPFTWSGLATSNICVVAGDIARDKNIVIDVLKELASCYNVVVYVDGNDEHRYSLDYLNDSITELQQQVEAIENVLFLHNKVAVIDGIAFVGANCWWTYDFDEPDSYDNTKQWFANRYKIDLQIASNIEEQALNDTNYLSNAITKLQYHKEVEEIVIVSHTVPFPILIDHDIEIQGSHLLNCSGSSHNKHVLNADTEGKISTWCFGHYHGGDVDTMLAGVRFVSNPKGRGNTKWCKQVYYPKKIWL